jgi:hypothetical protein
MLCCVVLCCASGCVREWVSGRKCEGRNEEVKE